MRTFVWYVELDAPLDLSRADLGCPQVPDLWERLHRHCRPGMLRCVDPHHPPEASPWLYLRENEDGSREARHIDAGAEHHGPGESDERKALKERIARAAEEGGFRAEIERRPAHRRRRTDVLVHGDGVMLGCEPQLSPISARTVRRRSDIAAAAGVTPVWMVNSTGSNAIDRAPWARIDRKVWHEYLTDTELPVRGGIRGLVIEQCSRMGTVCPDKRAGRPCSGWHGSWSDPLQATRFDDLVVRAAARDLVPVRERRSEKAAAWFWVTADDLAKVEPGDGGAAEVVSMGVTIPVPPHPRPLARYRRHGRGEAAHSSTALLDAPAVPPVVVRSPGPAARLPAPAPAVRPLRAGELLDWSDSVHMSIDEQPCRRCHRPAMLLDEWGRPCHKVCAEAERQG